MANFAKLSAVTPNRSDWRILVRVEKSWDTLDVADGEGLSFLFIDDEGTKMHAFVEQEHHKRRFKRDLQEGEWKVITGFSVVRDYEEIRLTRQRKKIALTSNTHISEGSNLAYFNPLDIVSYEDVWNGSVPDGTSYPRDFLGWIFEVEDLQNTVDDSIPRNDLNNDPKTTNKIDFVLNDNDGNQINVRAKGVLAEKFKRFWLCYGGTGTIICLCRDWRVMSTNGIQIEDAGGISTFEYNPTGYEAVEYFTNILCRVYEASEEDKEEEIE